MASTPDDTTVKAQLIGGRTRLAAAGIPTAWLDAEVLLAHVLKIERAQLHAHPERRLTPALRRRFGQLTTRRRARVPVAYLTGRREFYGIDLRVSPAVLIPRPESELLVELAISWLRDHPGSRRVIDLGTGSGAIAIAVAKAVPDVRIVAIDRDARALLVAAANIHDQQVAARVRPVKADLLEDARPADLIVANLPYLSDARRRAWAKELEFEPRKALDGGSDGLDVIRRALVQAPTVVRPGGCLLFECDPLQSRRIARLALDQWPAAEVTVRKDLAGRDRVVQVQLR